MPNESQEFDAWNELKNVIHSDRGALRYFPQAGEVWMSALGKNVGYEQNGGGGNFSRPVLIVKKFNNHMFWCAPLSTKQKSFDFYFNFVDPSGEKVSVILAQLKLMSVQRLKRKLYEIKPDLFSEMRTKLRDFLE